MKLSEETRRYILLTIIGIVIIGIFTAKWMGSAQDEQFSYEDQLYNTVQQYVIDEQGQEALPYMKELLENQPMSEIINYNAALVFADTGDMKTAAIHMQKTIDINPHKVEDPIFMIQFGEILFFAERFEDAKIVLLHCQAVGWVPEELPDYQNRVQQLLEQIEKV